MKKILLLLVLLVLLGIAGYLLLTNNAGISPQNTTTPPQQDQTTTDAPKTEVIARNLEVPWAIAFLPDGSMLVTERPGRVRLIDSSGNLSSTPVAQIENVKEIGEGGLHGIAIHPQFATNNYVYVYYTYGERGNQTLNRVSRLTYENTRLQNEQIIVDEIPGAQFHDGGRIKFGPDGYLYITTGDAQEPSLAQERDSLAGKILRVTDDGRPAPDNPFDTRIYSYGHRNPQGITWDDQGQLWATEHGSNTTDEVNLIQEGVNYGWPVIQGDQTQSGMTPPAAHSGNTTWAPAGMAYYNGSLYFGGLRGTALYQATLSDSKITAVTAHFENEFGRIRAVILGSDNMLYITTSNRDGRGNPTNDDDRIIRVNPEKL